MFVDEIARVCHEANRALQALQNHPGVPVAAAWDDFPDDEQAGAIAGVESALAGANGRQLHDAWCDRKEADGWVWGPVKDPTQKTHPCLVSYEQLPESQRVKDYLFHAIVTALAPTDQRDVAGPSEGHRVVLQGFGLGATLDIDGQRMRHVESASVAVEGGMPRQRVTLSFFTDQAVVLPAVEQE